MELSDNDLWLMLSAIEAYSAHIKLNFKKYNRALAGHKLSRMCDLSSRIYAETLRRDAEKQKDSE